MKSEKVKNSNNNNKKKTNVSRPDFYKKKIERADASLLFIILLNFF